MILNWPCIFVRLIRVGHILVVRVVNPNSSCFVRSVRRAGLELGSGTMNSRGPIGHKRFSGRLTTDQQEEGEKEGACDLHLKM